jgi:DNA-binding protein Fis
MHSSLGSVQPSINTVKSFAATRLDPEIGKTAIPFSSDGEFTNKLDSFSLESVMEHKIARFLDQVGGMYPEDLHDLILGKVEKPLLTQILRRMGGNQVQASRVLGINRNTLRKKMKMHGIKS